MDKQLTRRGQIVLLLATITVRQIKVNPIPSFIWVSAAAKGGQIQKNMFVLLSGNFSITLWGIECGGRDKTESHRRTTSSSSSLSSPYLAVCRMKALLFSAWAHAWRRLASTHNTHSNSNTHGNTHMEIHTSPGYVHFSYFRPLRFLLPDVFQTKHHASWNNKSYYFNNRKRDVQLFV